MSKKKLKATIEHVEQLVKSWRLFAEHKSDALAQCHRELARTANAIDDIYRASAEGRDLICKYYGHWHPQFVAELPEYKLRETLEDKSSE